MDKRAVILTVLVALVVLCSPGKARAHDYMVSDYWADYQALANDVQSIMDAVYTQYAGCNLYLGSRKRKPPSVHPVCGVQPVVHQL